MTHNRANNSSYRELICTGANPDTITTEDFSEESIAEGIKKLKAKDKVEENFGDKKKTAATDDDNSPWGDDDTTSNDDEDIEW